MKTTAFSKTYNGRTVLTLPALELPPGQITAVIGPNGSGKSTFAKILAGIERADDKKPILSGISVGYLPQKSFPFRMSTEKNILQNGKNPQRAAALMQALGIEGLAGQSAKESTLAAEKLICETSREQGCALVLITHSISQARRIADCVIVLHQGRLIEQGESIQVLSKPKQEKTKRFLEFYGL